MRASLTVENYGTLAATRTWPFPPIAVPLKMGEAVIIENQVPPSTKPPTM